MHNLDHKEIETFNNASSEWWEKDGTFKTLHDINPSRLQFIRQAIDLRHQKVVDVGCGGGILSESMAREGANVLGIDMANLAIEAAQAHAANEFVGEKSFAPTNLQGKLRYQETTAEDMAQTHAGEFDVLTCMELLEHVPSPSQLIHDCAKLVKPGGHLFFSTINRTLKAYLSAIVAAEYVLKLLPKGIHHYEKFIRPSELSHWARSAELRVVNISGLCYYPLLRYSRLTSNVAVNYLIHYEKAKS